MTAEHPLRRLFRHARAHRPQALWATLFSALNKLFDVLPEVLIGMAVDVVVNKKASFLARFGIVPPEHQLLLLGGFTVAIWVFESLFEYLYAVRWRNLAQDLQHDLRMEAYAHVQRLELGWFEDRRTGNLMAVLNDDINQMERFLNGGANDLIQIVTGSVLVGGVFFALTTKIAFLALIPIPLIVYGAFWFQGRLAPRYAQVREAAGTLNSRLNNNLLGIATIKAYAAEEHEVSRVHESSQAYRAANSHAIRFSAAITPIIRMAVLAGFAVTLLYGGFMALSGELGVGSYSVLVYLTQRLLWPMTRLADMTDLYQRSMASVERVMNLLETNVRIPYAGRALAPSSVRGELRFENVSFAYGTTPTLSQLQLVIRAGTNVAFVGSTGSGKSSLVKLILRFYEPQHGVIRLDGVPIGELALQDLRRVIGYVAQDSFLADASVAENIAYGLDGPGREAIVAAAVAAEAHDFIQALPNGYDTQVGERGQKLSGGQRQRIALARAIVRDPRILILDEATSAVDNETEAAIQRSLEKLVVGRTSLIIAHRLSTVRHADIIYVVEGGRIVESGTHDELLVHRGQYATLWSIQTGEQTQAARADLDFDSEPDDADGEPSSSPRFATTRKLH
ncbi:MAG TPA: ABC transporter ATP-binding protein [Polyangiaceae bacterium]|nr:ABC transporter ATP-binding protein [Polyangiaceae bacterium]